MTEHRERTIELLTATQVAMAELYYNIMQDNPLLAKLMMDKLKAFLGNDYFATMERQTILMRFLEEHTNMEVIQDVLNYVKTCSLKSDYTTIIMEWTFHNSENIVKQALAKYDGSLLCLKKQNPPPQFKRLSANSTDEFVQAILQISSQVLADNEDDDGDDDLEI